MHRRAHGGAWGAAALLIGSCSLVEAAEPPRLPTKYSSGTISNSAHLSGVSSFSAAGSFAPSPAPTVGQMIEIVPTPIVPSASALSQRGQLFQPTTVAHVPHAPQVLPPTTVGLTPTDLSGATVLGNTLPKVTIVGPLVPVNLSPQEKELLEKALRGSTQTNQPLPTKDPKSKKTAIDPFAPTNSKPSSPEAKPKMNLVKPPVVESKVTEAADEIDDETQAALDPPMVEPESSAAKKALANRVTSSPAKIAEVPESAKIVPLPPLDREVPSKFAMPLNLPQPPIPLEFPRTDAK